MISGREASRPIIYGGTKFAIYRVGSGREFLFIKENCMSWRIKLGVVAGIALTLLITSIGYAQDDMQCYVVTLSGATSQLIITNADNPVCIALNESNRAESDYKFGISSLIVFMVVGCYIILLKARSWAGTRNKER